jgi:hypothetical protein
MAVGSRSTSVTSRRLGRTVARRAEVCRTFLCQNAAARGHVEDVAAQTGEQRQRDRDEQAEHVEASWQQRALNAKAALKNAGAEISLQRNTIALLLGQIRDLEHDLPEDGIQRLITENTTLKQNVRELTQQGQRLEERLVGARSNNRFLDKRVAEPEACLLDQGWKPSTTEADRILS